MKPIVTILGIAKQGISWTFITPCGGENKTGHNQESPRDFPADFRNISQLNFDFLSKDRLSYPTCVSTVNISNLN